MELKELRLGNLVYENRIKINEAGLYFTKTTIRHIIEWDIECFNEAVNGKDKFEPISLNTEWLLKLGLKKISDNFEFRNIYFRLNGPMICINAEEPTGAIDVKCEYIHKIQNILFDLTGEMPTIKE